MLPAKANMATAAADLKVGKVIQVIGPVIDVEYEGGHLPAIYNAVRIVDDGSSGGEKVDIVAEVEQHLGEGRVRTVAMKPTDGFIATVRTRPSPRCCSTSATMSTFSPPDEPSSTMRTAL